MQILAFHLEVIELNKFENSNQKVLNFLSVGQNSDNCTDAGRFEHLLVPEELKKIEFEKSDRI